MSLPSACACKFDIRRAAETDDVADTVSYADVHTAVKAEMDIPSKLLEHVCGRIINRLFHDFPQIEEITLKLAKRNPPMGADIEAAGVEYANAAENDRLPNHPIHY